MGFFSKNENKNTKTCSWCKKTYDPSKREHGSGWCSKKCWESEIDYRYKDKGGIDYYYKQIK